MLLEELKTGVRAQLINAKWKQYICIYRWHSFECRKSIFFSLRLQFALFLERSSCENKKSSISGKQILTQGQWAMKMKWEYKNSLEQHIVHLLALQELSDSTVPLDIMWEVYVCCCGRSAYLWQTCLMVTLIDSAQNLWDQSAKQNVTFCIYMLLPWPTSPHVNT